jgi:hypothetical protein
MLDLAILPVTHNNELVKLERPKVLTLEQFNELPVSKQEFLIRNQIYALEEVMFAMPGSMNDKEMSEQDMIPIHRFVNGLYHRELTIPPDRIVVGKRHAIEHIVMLTAGSCWCITERGKEFMVAPLTFISPAGEKRVVITTLDEGCTWVTLHPTDKTNLDEIEQQVIISEPERKEYLDILHLKSKEIEMTQHYEVRV